MSRYGKGMEKVTPRQYLFFLPIVNRQYVYYLFFCASLPSFFRSHSLVFSASFLPRCCSCAGISYLPFSLGKMQTVASQNCLCTSGTAISYPTRHVFPPKLLRRGFLSIWHNGNKGYSTTHGTTVRRSFFRSIQLVRKFEPLPGSFSQFQIKLPTHFKLMNDW